MKKVTDINSILIDIEDLLKSNDNIFVAIDGHSASGKSTLAHRIYDANKLNY